MLESECCSSQALVVSVARYFCNHDYDLGCAGYESAQVVPSVHHSKLLEAVPALAKSGDLDLLLKPSSSLVVLP